MVVNEIMEEVRPKKPEGAKHLGFSNDLWRTVERTWPEDRNARPRVEDILVADTDRGATRKPLDRGYGVLVHERALARDKAAVQCPG